jgi:predicted amidophosphoribosyltransferase
MSKKPDKTEEKHLFCPYCEQEISELQYPYCQACKVEIFYCPQCRKPVSRENETCPECGAKIKG